jgi:hypothetical protein
MPGQSLPVPGDATVHRVAPVAQGIERAPPERKVVGSIPTGRMLTGSCRPSTAWSGRANRGRRVPAAPDPVRGEEGQPETYGVCAYSLLELLAMVDEFHDEPMIEPGRLEAIRAKLHA